MANYKLDYTGEQINTAIGNALSGAGNIAGHSISFNFTFNVTNPSSTYIQVIWLDNNLIPHYDKIPYAEISTYILRNVYKIFSLFLTSDPDANYISTNVDNAICYFTSHPGTDYSTLNITQGIKYISTGSSGTQFANNYNTICDLYVLKDTTISFNRIEGGTGN